MVKYFFFFKEMNIHHYKVEYGSEEDDGMTERDVKLKGLSGQDSFFYKTVSPVFINEPLNMIMEEIGIYIYIL